LIYLGNLAKTLLKNQALKLRRGSTLVASLVFWILR